MCTVRLQSVKLCYGLRGIGLRPIRFEIRFERKKRFAQVPNSPFCRPY